MKTYSWNLLFIFSMHVIAEKHSLSFMQNMFCEHHLLGDCLTLPEYSTGLLILHFYRDAL